MRIGAVALGALAMIAAGLLLYGVADVGFGAYLAVAGLVVAGGSTLAARAWLSRHDEDDFG